jgi:hypothetical protein
MHSKHAAGATKSSKDAFDIFLTLVGEIPPTWVKFVRNKDLIGGISTREGENTPICVIDLSEYGHLFNNRQFLSFLCSTEWIVPLSCFRYATLCCVQVDARC